MARVPAVELQFSQAVSAAEVLGVLGPAVRRNDP